MWLGGKLTLWVSEVRGIAHVGLGVRDVELEGLEDSGGSEGYFRLEIFLSSIMS